MAQVVAVLAVETRRVPGGLAGVRVLLRPAGAAAALARPAHRRSLCLEAIPVTEEPAGEHTASVTAAGASSLKNA